jgi:hypothetical protein
MPNTISIAAALSVIMVLAGTPSSAQECDAAGTVGSAGSASAGETSASTVGTAGACTTDGGTTASIGSGGSAATADGKVQSRTKINENDNQLKARSKAQAMDQGTFSKSQTKTRVKGNELESSIRTMSHVPGEKPVKSITGNSVILPGQ